VACLVADGDRMGRALEGMPRIEQHRTFSERLSYFAERAREIVEQEHRGILVYAGGDDVLGLINVAQALRCAEALRAAFAQIVKDALADAAPETPLSTLSVGLGIGHLLESMGQLRRLGGEAEKLAKTRRNALAVLVDRRGGGLTRLREDWNTEPVTRIESAVALLESRQLSMKKVHEIGAELSRMPAKGSLLESEQTAWADLLRSEVERILARSRDGDDLTAPEVGLDFRPNVSYDDCRSEVDSWVSRILVAKVLADANHAARPKGRG
jgi:CRISPR-associated protein Cmr2